MARNDAAWYEMYNEAKLYLEEHGDLNVPVRYVTSDGKKLGSWIVNNRRLCDPESERGKLLLQLNPDFFKLKRTILPWNEMYLCALDYFNEHNDLNVSITYVTSDGKKLGSWLQYQKFKCDPDSKYGKLLLQLNPDFFKLKRTTFSWDEMYEKAKKYVQDHGNLDVPDSYVTDDGKKLGQWLRTKKSSCDPKSEQGKLLIKIGFDFDTSDDVNMFWEKYKLAEAYFNKYGNLEVPYNFKTSDGVTPDPNGVNLGMWIAKKRERCAPESDQGQLLAKIGMRFETRTMLRLDWKKMIKLLDAYYAKYGNSDVPYLFRTDDGVSYKATGMKLGRWLYSAKKYYDSNSVQGELLIAYGVKLENKSEESISTAEELEWLRMLKIALEYVKQNGSIESLRYSKETKELFDWVARQKKSYRDNTLSAEKIAAMDTLGIVWNPMVERLCMKLNIDVAKNSDILRHMTISEFKARLGLISYLNQKGYDIITVGDSVDLVEYDIEVIDSNGMLHEIFSMTDDELKLKYGKGLADFSDESSKQKSKKKN